MNCIWIIVLLFCVGNQGRCTSECGCMTERRDTCDRGGSRGDWTEGRRTCDRDCSKDTREERQEKRSECSVEENRRRSAFDDWEDNTCPCRREADYYRAEINDIEEKTER